MVEKHGNTKNYRDKNGTVDKQMLMTVSKVRAAFVYLKSRFKYLSPKGKVGEFEPNVFFGYTDHPLDTGATPITTTAALIKKATEQLLMREAKSVLQVALKERTGNSFKFLARGYNIYKIINQDIMFRHEYIIKETTKYKLMAFQVDFLKDDVYRLRLAEGNDIPENKTPMIDKEISDPHCKVTFIEKTECYDISTSKLTLKIFKQDFRIEIFDAEGTLLTESGSKTKNEFPNTFDTFPLGFIRMKKLRRQYGVESFTLNPGEAIYGLGEHFGSVNNIGKTIGIWNTDGLGNTSGRAYKNIPFFMSTQGYGVFVNESRPITFWVGSRETCKNMFAVEGDLIDYFFFYGPDFKTILHEYTELTGKPQVPPKWSFGTWISRISYFSQKEVIAVAGRLRDMKFPADVIHIDTGWFDVDWRCDWKFSQDRFPDPKKMFSDAEKMGFKICLWQHPYVLEETEIYKDAQNRKALAKNHGPFAFLFMYPGNAIDFSRKEGVAWYKEKLQNLLEMGAASIKVDFGEGIEPHMEFKKYDGRQMHNLYPLLYQKAAFEICEKIRGKGEAVLWARSGYAGSQRYPVHWCGDNSSNHENLLSSLRSGLSLGLCGFSFWSQDTGGFVGVPSDDVYIRWTQVSIFQSHIRFHGNPPHYKEPWNFEPGTQEIVRNFLNLRYQLIPYLYSEAHHSAGAGLPMLRHLVVEYQDDPNVYNIEDQFLCGRSILVAPILTKNNVRKIYLPKGKWYHFWTGEKIDGSQWITVEAELKTIPVFIKEGTVLPLAKVGQYTGELSYDDLTLKVCLDETGKAAYDIMDHEKKMSIRIETENDTLLVSIQPEPKNVKVEITAGMHISKISINNHIKDYKSIVFQERGL